jgi:hypothetical protein
LSAESELFPSASATDVATEHIQEEKSEENHDYPPLTPPNEAPSSDSTSCGIFPDAGPSIDFQVIAFTFCRRFFSFEKV